ncbi:MAG: hypothetical protein WBP41_04725 [Saprospiraceae bacterium]
MKYLAFGMIVIVTGIIIAVGGCKDEVDPTFKAIDTSQDFIVFGSVYGECTGDCRDLFMITETNLYTDADQNVDLKNTLFGTDPLPKSKFETAKSLLNAPDNLKNNSFQPADLIDIIADFDYYIYGQVDGKNFDISFDAIDSIVNPDLHAYASMMGSVLHLIR